MPRFAANLSFMYADLPFLARFEAAARDGFKAVEYLFPYAWDAKELAARLRVHGLQQVLFNAAPGGTDAVSIQQAWDAGKRGLACLAGQESEFRASVLLALDYAQALACPRIHVMAGLATPGSTPSELQATYVHNLRWAAAQAAPYGVEVLIEPINQRDMPGYFLNRQAHAHATLLAVGAPNLKVQMDLYHCQIVEGDVAMKLRQYLPSGHIGHIQVASVPARQEPDSGELSYPFLLNLIDELGYAGWVGCEYQPRLGAQPGGTTAGLDWCQAWL